MKKLTAVHLVVTIIVIIAIALKPSGHINPIIAAILVGVASASSYAMLYQLFKCKREFDSQSSRRNAEQKDQEAFMKRTSVLPGEISDRFIVERLQSRDYFR